MKISRLFSMGAAGAVALSLVIGGGTAYAATPATVTIPDPALLECVNGALKHRFTEPVLRSELQELTKLSCDSSSISSLIGLQQATALKQLDLSSNNISNITQISKLTALEALDLSGNQVTSITALDPLMALTGLDISNNPIADLSPIVEYTQLRRLGASGLGLTDPAPVTGLTQLRQLDLANNELTSAAPLVALRYLTLLNLSGNHITDLSPLKPLKNLKTLTAAEQSAIASPASVGVPVENSVLGVDSEAIPVSDEDLCADEDCTKLVYRLADPGTITEWTTDETGKIENVNFSGQLTRDVLVTSATPQKPAQSDNTVTIPESEQFSYKIVGGSALEPGDLTLTKNLSIEAVALPGYQLATGAAARWDFKYTKPAPAPKPETPKTKVAPTPKFVDVGTKHKFFTQINWMYNNKLSTGTVQGGKRYYRPSNDVSREAMAAFLYRTEKAKFVGPKVSPFADVKPGNKFYNEITWMHAKGIATGVKQPNGKPRFMPKSGVTREAMAAFMYRLKGGAAAVPKASPFADVKQQDKFYTEIVWMRSSGLSTGTKQKTGKPLYRAKNNVSREAMAAFLYRAARG